MRIRWPSLTLAALLAGHGVAAQDGAARRELPLLPTPADLATHEAEARARALADTLETWPGVKRARLHLSVPELARAQLDEPPTPRAAAVSMLVEPGAQVDATRVRSLVAGAVDGLEAAHVEVVLTPAPARNADPAPPTLQRVGPFKVEAGSAPALRGVFAAGLGLLAGLALALILTLRRARRSEGQ